MVPFTAIALAVAHRLPSFQLHLCERAPSLNSPQSITKAQSQINLNIFAYTTDAQDLGGKREFQNPKRLQTPINRKGFFFSLGFTFWNTKLLILK